MRNAGKLEAFVLVKFCLIGILNTSIDFVLFMCLAGLAGVPEALAHTVSYSAGIVNSYIFNTLWTFSEKNLLRRSRFIKFVAVNLLSYLTSLAIILAVSDGIPLWGKKSLAILVSLSINFALSRYWVFKRISPNIVSGE